MFRKKVSLLLVILTFFIVIISILSYKKTPLNKEIPILKEQQIIQSLNRSYFYYNNPINFSTVGLQFEYSDPFKMYWLFMISENFKDTKMNLDVFQMHLKDINLETDNLFDINYITSIYKCLNYDNYNTEEFTEVILKNYDENNDLFYKNTVSDNISDKITATILSLKALKNINQDLDAKEDILKSLISLYNDDTFFDKKETISDNILTLGGNIIHALYIQGYTYNELSGNLKSRSEWLDYLNVNVWDTIDPSNVTSIYILQSLREINYFFEKEFLIPTDFFDEFFIANNNFYLASGINTFRDVNPEIIYYTLDMCKSIDYPYYYIPELNKYMEDSISKGFSPSGNILINIRDNYHGIALASKYNYQYDKTKMGKLLKEMNAVFLGNANPILSSEELEDIYYLLLSCKKLGIDIIDSETINNKMVEYLKKIEYKDIDNLDGVLNNFYLSTRIINLLGCNLSKELEYKIIDAIIHIDAKTQVYNIENIVKINYLSMYLNSEDKKIINKKVQESLNSYSYENLLHSESCLIYEILKLKKDLKCITTKDLNMLEEYMLVYIGPHRLNGLSFKLYDPDLESIYYAVQLQKLYYDTF